MPGFVLATVDVPDQERKYYNGPKRSVPARMAHKITHLLDRATTFDTREEAEAMNGELGGTYQVVALD